jgi:pimeloyl-ACP methyl ester carboxylesterase
MPSLRNLALLLTISMAGCQATAAGTGEKSGAAVADASNGTDASQIDLDVDPWPSEAVGATARYDLTGKDWHAQPFPTNSRRSNDGSLDLSGFPPPRDGDMPDLIQQYLDYATNHLRGWSLQATVYVQFDAPLDSHAVRAAADTLNQDAYFLMDVDPTSPEYGSLVPLVGRTTSHQRLQHLFPDMLMVQPAWGRPLRPLTTYAFVVRRGWLDAAGKILGRPTALAAVLDHELGGVKTTLDEPQQRLASTLQPLVAAYKAGKLTVPWRDIAATTVFTTGDPTGQLVAMAEWVRTKMPVKPAIAWKKVSATKTYTLYTATYDAPNFQQGACPYDEDGSGAFEFKPDGTPIVQHTEPLRLAVTIPLDLRHASQEGKLPVALSAHGTGGDYLSFTNDGIATNLTARGLAVVSIDQPMHGPRCVPEITGAVLDLKSFNFLNVAAGRTSFQQSALDTVFLGRLVREGLIDVPETVAVGGQAVHFDPQRVVFIGHSQGGLSGSLAAAIDSHFNAFVLSGAGAGISLTVMLRKFPADIANTLGTVLGLDKGELSEFHPAVTIVQQLADITDPLSYARLILHRAPGERPPHVLLTEGLLDQDTPSPTAEALAAAIGLQVLAPKVHLDEAMEIAGTPVLPSPVQDNLKIGGFSVTAVVSQWAKFDHFVIFNSDKAKVMYSTFLETAIDSGEAIAEVK